MQDIHSFGGGHRLFSGGGGDRRLRSHNLQNHQALKCPRCDSLNTKFCYYNNYNLSQPRHFCKSCRRYWTRGGVLRNVPVGGGCRKTKRSRPKQVASENAATGDDTPQPEETKPSVSHSSSESSSLTAAAVNGGLEAVSTAKNGESELFGNGIFSEIESLTSLVTSSRDSHVPFGFGNVMTQQSLENNVQESLRYDHQKMPETAEGLVASATMNGSVFESLDWHGGLFDFPTTGVDQTYWTQSEWTYLP